MSRRHHATLAIEWSARQIAVYDATTGVTKTFADLLEAKEYAGKTAIVGVSRRSLFARTTRVPNADAATIHQVLNLRASELFPVAPGEIAVDSVLSSDVDIEGRLALAIAIPSGDLRRIRAEAKEVGIKIERVVPLALGSALVGRAVSMSNGAVVSRESVGVGIDIVVDGELRYSRLVAENPALGAEVCRTFAVVNAHCTDILSVGQVLDSEANQTTTKNPLEALLGDWPSDWTINLELPDEVIARRKKDEKRQMSFALTFLLGTVAIAITMATNYADDMDKVRIETSKATSKVKHLKSILKGDQAEASTQGKYVTTLDRAFKPAQRLGDVVTLIGNRVPEGAWLTGVSLERGKPIVIRGSAKTGDIVNEYQSRLTKEERLRDVRLIFANSALVNETPIVQFSIEAFPIGNLPLADATNRRRSTTK